MLQTQKEKTLQIPSYIGRHKYYNKWLKFHLDNRHIIRLIISKIESAKATGLRVSIKTIIGSIRYDEAIRTKADNFKINDAFTSLYGHIIAYNFPELEETFTIKNFRK